jgi:putative SOS response-associated peptidase YedK
MCFSVDPDVGIDRNKGMKFIDPAFIDWLKAQMGKGLSEAVFPGGQCPFVYQTEKLHVGMGTFGIIPSWAKNKDYAKGKYNARAETIFEKISYKDAVRFRRGVVWVKAFWEWSEAEHEPDGKKHLYCLKGVESLPLGCIWENHSQFGLSLSLVTTEPLAQVMTEAHHVRSPLILGDIESWLDPTKTKEAEIKPFLTNTAKPLVIERVK